MHNNVDDLQSIIDSCDYLLLLSQGIDPTSRVSFETDTILNNRDIIEKLKIAAKYLRDYYNLMEGKEQKTHKISFSLPTDALESFEYSQEPITISQLTYKLNGLYKHECMYNLKARDLTKWLAETGYLRTVILESGQLNKVPTPKGLKAGITSVERTNSMDEKYIINYYSVNAQKLIIKHLLLTAEREKQYRY